MDENSPLIFISYASPDRDIVLPYFAWLEKNGFNVWMDCRRIKPGQNWDFEIKLALDKATFFLFFISNSSINRRGYLQKELKLALDKFTEKLIDDIYLIPVLLDDVEIPTQLKSIQCIKASEPDCKKQIADALQHQLERLGFERQELQEREQVYWTSQIKREEWDGIPGYEIDLQFLTFRSDPYPNVFEIGDYIKGWLLKHLFEYREYKLSQFPDSYNYGQNKGYRTNTFDAHCDEPVIVGKVISIKYSIYWYGAGAAHGHYTFQTYSFLLEPVILIRNLESIFIEPDIALTIIQTIVREQLYKTIIEILEEQEDETVRKWIDDGTKDWDGFKSFIFKPDGIEISFGAYQVVAYAFGPQFAEIPYKQIVSLIKNEYLSALGIHMY